MAAKNPKTGACESENERLVNQEDALKLTLNAPPVEKSIVESDEQLITLSQDTETSVTGGTAELKAKPSGDFSRVPKVTGNEALVTEDVHPPTHDCCAKVPQFDTSSKGKTVEYTVYSNNPRKTKSVGSHLNSDVGDKRCSPSATKTIVEPKEELSIDITPNTTTYVPDSRTPTSNGLKQMPSTQVSLHHQGKGRRAKVPQFGEWSEGCSTEADGYTLMFSSAKEARTKLRNNGRVPLNWDFGADRAQPLPFADEDAFGGGNRTTYDQRRDEADVQPSNYIQHSGGSTPEVHVPVHPEEGTPKHKISHRVNQSRKLTLKKQSCFRWF